MSIVDRLDMRFPRLAFARHVPPQQIVHRLRQRAGRRLFGPALGQLHRDTRLLPLDRLTRPIFPARSITASRTGSGWHFRFIGRSHDCGDQIDWSAPGPSPADQLWRMNLHYMEFLEALPVDQGLSAIEQWIAGNPVTRPGALSDAWNSYAVSIRIVCWLQWLARHAATLAPEQVTGPSHSLLEQAAFLEVNLELDIGGNHLFKNIKALILISQSVSGPDCTRWHDLGLRLLRTELDRQILSDGMHFELSPSYHCQVTADLIEILTALPPEHAREFHAIAARMVWVAARLAHPDGLSAQFNDAGLTMAYPPGQLVDAAAKLGLPRFEGETDGGHLPSSGYLIWRDAPDTCLIIKGGAIGADHLPAHAHGDHGSFELSLGGQRFIVDQGVHVYVAGPDRQQSRSAHAHNVTSVVGMDQAHFFGDFRVGWRTRPKSAVLEREGDALSLTLHGCHSSPNGTKADIERRLEMSPGQILLTDGVKSFQSVSAHCAMLVHPDVTISVEGPSALLDCSNIRLTITTLPFASSAINRLAKTDLTPACPTGPKIVDAVWWPDMGHAIATKRLVWDIPPESGTIALSLAWNNESNR